MSTEHLTHAYDWKRKNSSKFGLAWEWEGRNQGSKFSRVLSIYFWGLILGLTDCNELFVTEKEHRDIPILSGFLWFTSPPALKVYLKLWGWQRSFSDSSKLHFLEKNFPTTTDDSRHRISCAKEELLKCFQLFLILKAGRKAWVFCLPWLAVPGAQSTSVVGQEVSQGWNSAHQGNECSCSPALFLDTIFWSFCNTVIPFVQFGVLVGKTQNMDVLELLTLKAALNALSPKLGSVQCKHSFTRILCLMNET